MKTKAYKNYDEELFTEVLDNGLTVNLLPKAGYHKTYAVFTTNFGSLDNQIKVDGQTVTIPAGTAHFLEHKMFEKEDYDAFDLFSKNGADANAFTSYSRTSYLFSTTVNLKENLNSLLDFVQRPYFSAKSVAKEQGIIGQEIQMYNDDPDWQSYMGILKNLFPNHAMGQDIAGSINSISEITPEVLYQIHELAYRPSNMNLFVVGGFDAKEVLDWIKDNQNKKHFENKVVELSNNQNDNLQSDGADIIREAQQVGMVQRPKVMIGLRGLKPLPAKGIARLKYIMELDLALYLLLSSSSQSYLELYDKGILDDTFGYELNAERDIYYLTISGDTNNPDDFKQKIEQVLKNGVDQLKDQDQEFELAQKEMIGRSITKMNSIEAIANSFEGEWYGNSTVFDEADLYQTIKFEDVQKDFADFISGNMISTFQTNSRGDQK